MGATVIVKCARCKQPFEARIADRNRGWGKFCSKSCKAIRQTQRTGVGAGGRTYLPGGGYITPDGSQYDRHGHFEGFQMRAADLALGGYGDADKDSQFGDGKW